MSLRVAVYLAKPLALQRHAVVRAGGMEMEKKLGCGRLREKGEKC